MAGYDVSSDRPVLRAYIERVRADLQPHYDEVMTRFDIFVEKYVKKEDLLAKL